MSHIDRDLPVKWPLYTSEVNVPNILKIPKLASPYSVWKLAGCMSRL